MSKCLVYGTLLLAFASLCVAGPEPAVVQRPGQWTVEVKFEQPQQLVLPWGGNGDAHYWYTIITVTNRTGQDVEFFPRCELMTDTFQIVPAGTSVPPVVFDKIKQRHKDRYPLLQSLNNVEQRILQGQDNAKDIAIVWKDFDNKATGFKLFVTGLSNETAMIHHPVAVDAEGNPLQVFLRKTLVLNYALRGDPAMRSVVEVAYKGKSWVMR